jgi:K+-transporting ATPase KdpF subunit
LAPCPVWDDIHVRSYSDQNDSSTTSIRALLFRMGIGVAQESPVNHGYRLSRRFVRFFLHICRHCPDVGSIEEKEMRLFAWISLVIGIGLCIYLLVFLIDPERFL